MPILVLFNIRAAAQGSSITLTLELLREHNAFADNLRKQGRLLSSSDSAAISGQDRSPNQTLGYILDCGTVEDAESVVKDDPLYRITDGRVQYIPWTSSSGPRENETAKADGLQKQGFDPIFPVTDMQRSLRHYTALGFRTEAFDDQYAFAILPGIGCIHLTLLSDHDPKINAAATYLHIADADALTAQWRRDCPQGDTRDPVDTDYGLREGAHLDPDNNLIRFGSKIRSS